MGFPHSLRRLHGYIDAIAPFYANLENDLAIERLMSMKYGWLAMKACVLGRTTAGTICVACGSSACRSWPLGTSSNCLHQFTFNTFLGTVIVRPAMTLSQVMHQHGCL